MVHRLKSLDMFSGSLSQRTYLSLRAAIIELVYPPGALLRKGEICEALGVSRSPVSEAISRLANERLVRVVPKAGTYAARFSIDEIKESAFIREAIEVAAIRELAPQVTDAQLVELRRNLRVQEALVADGDDLRRELCEMEVEVGDTRSSLSDAERREQALKSELGDARAEAERLSTHLRVKVKADLDSAHLAKDEVGCLLIPQSQTTRPTSASCTINPL